MKRASYLLLIIVFLFGCQGSQKSGKEIISVSILPQKYLVEKIAADRFFINVLVPPGVSPETYELTPVQMKRLSDSRVYFTTGHLTFEELWRRKFEKMNIMVNIVDISEGIDLISIKYAHGDHYHHGTDPHVWVSPKSMRIMAANIFKNLCHIDPDNKGFYDEGFKKLLAEINSADEILTGLFQGVENKSFLIFHPALGYLARDYDLEQIPVEFEGKSPPPAYIRKVVDLSREKNLNAILIQKEFSDENARAIAREIKGEIITIDPLDENWYDQIIFIGETLSKIFKGEQ
jgi:zinc transport system substrate-binding protein